MLINCTVSGNSAISGGGIYNQATLNVTSSNIINNSATSKGGGISTTAGNATITNSVINRNQVNSLGYRPGRRDRLREQHSGADQLHGQRQPGHRHELPTAAGSMPSTARWTSTNCTVNGNGANGTVVGEGGGIYALDCTLTLVNTNVKGNKATTAYNNIFNGP